MRIISGRARRARIVAPRGAGTRPITERLRGAVFNILGKTVEGAEVLDLFAGSGSLGLEALSRGAMRCVFVERSRPALGALRRNIEALGFTDRSRVVAGDALKLRPERLGVPFDLVFIDPPHALAGRLEEESPLGGLLRNLLAGGVLKDTGVAVLRTPLKGGKVWHPEEMSATMRRYGAEAVWFLRRSAEVEPNPPSTA